MRKQSSLKQKLHAINVKADKALRAAVAKVVEEYRKTGDPLAIWRDGKVVWISPAEAKRLMKKAS